MFEAEVEMERRSSFLPMVLMMCLVAAIAGLAIYIVLQIKERTPLTAQQATGIVAAAIHGPGPAVIHFRTGMVKATNDDKPGDPNYRLLEKAGIVKMARSKGDNTLVSLTPEGDRLLTGIPNFKKTQEADGTTLYQAPLADRQFLNVTGVEMSGVNTATVSYSWKWVPNQLGDVFDAGGSLVKGFNMWERQTLISKYQADFYHGDPTRSAIGCVRNGKEWKISGQ